MAKDVIIIDNNFQDAAKEIKEYGSHLASMTQEYARILDYITAEAIMDDQIAPNIQNIADQVRKIGPVIEEQTDKIEYMLNDFINQIDEADQFLY